MSPHPNNILALHEGNLATSIRAAISSISKRAETIELAAQQLQQLVLGASGDSPERELRAVVVAGGALATQLALDALALSSALGLLEMAADVRRIAEGPEPKP